MITVKRGDTHVTRWKTNADLTASTVRLIARDKKTKAVTFLTAIVSNAGEGIVEHTLTGTLPAGKYWVELEITRQDGIYSAPSNGYELLCVLPDLG